ncbi:A/G-specific adenine glycosylase [Trinickia caryophylli]|uniref:Adenine DNA glycosylase n=1 Tax=Trinickia caryophylli TaxID=28094 RepID=A0A1X7EQX0_TRICW|nr:A/G-specific adenine glycosylase [Trinickia caryophylli]PMS12037.1 A/G-specific adenine glycosylase [Trinickia caryophylli]TRX18656.1 A/G-specific adenine glycosylase [Trinickia caryophylli]WQE10549.1 A/G-specific adenine glycosylase [Trinickia caryophylli]SMF38454.1 A/G-specific DNA-adenine glycosylase [Trinickia caryophylli]GLU32907.1 A/G-specific adenine glycosylase [Trinickia caryophylli]
MPETDVEPVAEFIPPPNESVPAASPASSASFFAPRLIDWQRRHGRHDLPWQNTRDPYRIWLSEIMLQQTQVSTVIPYYARFLERFPDVGALAAAPIDEVMALWAGLGYYSRARNLHRCAQAVVELHGGVFPASPEALADLPGIGRSTAAAIASFAFGARATILDGNVKRVLARVFGIEGFPGEKRVENAMWALAESLLPSGANDDDVSAYTQGLMDLGATLCVRSRPECPRCPFAADCVANATGRQRELPGARPRKTVPTRRTWMLVLRNADAVLLERRPPAGIWGGLWSLPEAADEDALAACANALGAAGVPSRLAPLTHTFTHFRLDIEPRLAEFGGAPPSPAGELRDEASAWVPLAQIEAYGVPAPVRKLLDALKGSLL